MPSPAFTGALLALDTSLHACSAALARVEDGRVIETLTSCSLPMTRGHAEALMPMVAEVMAEAKLDAPDRIAVTRGPGSFTGLRVALSAARALGLAWKRPVVGVGTLHALADESTHVRTRAGTRLGVVDARLGRVYAQGFRGDTPLWEPGLYSAYELMIALRAHSGPWSSCGQLPFDAPSELNHMHRDAPDIAAVLRLGAVADAAPTPVYIRGADAVRPALPPARSR